MKTDVYESETVTAPMNRPQSGANAQASGHNQEDMMKKMQAAGTPGAEHKALQSFVGDWQVTVKCWMDPNGQAMESHGTAKVTAIFDGRYFEEEFSGEMMGKPFNGRGLLGFDNTKLKFQLAWLDDMSTGIKVSEGRSEKNHQVITLEGKMDCPGTGQKDLPIKQVYRVINNDKRVLEMFNDGWKSMEITYTRR
jgi:hypothetical protein